MLSMLSFNLSGFHCYSDLRETLTHNVLVRFISTLLLQAPALDALSTRRHPLTCAARGEHFTSQPTPFPSAPDHTVQRYTSVHFLAT
ncbi:hypothetical protein I79_014464 [Cricetulus griseus]|uniref:Uncharacterized protein n=1 Tax=Cricetulus griseus TaxID=10029 RepID=G3HU58_CRIGR|nr:hypothetical protein I79_014464 [Cricetulus griseus]